MKKLKKICFVIETKIINENEKPLKEKNLNRERIYFISIANLTSASKIILVTFSHFSSCRKILSNQAQT